MALNGDVSGPDQKEKMFRDFDLQIEVYQKALLDLRTRRNAMSPIFILLPELLCQIFHICVDVAGQEEAKYWAHIDSPSIGIPRTSYQHARAALTISHVCRRWRAIAREDGVLWTNLFMSSDELCRRMLVRSKNALLVVRHGFVSSDSSSASLSLALSHMSRIRTLQISWQAYSTYVPPKLMEHMSQPAPFLENLYLSNLGGVWSTNPLPLTLFSGEIPRLTRLTILHGAQISWDSPLIQKTSLTHLHLGDMTHWKSDSVDHLLDVLQRFPRLKSLLLEQSIPIGPAMSDRVVKLPALTGISLADDQTACMVLLRSLSIPPTALLSLQTFLNPQDGDVNPTLSGSLTHIVPFFKNTKTVRMHITKDAGVNQLRIQSWPTTITDRTVLGNPHSSSTLIDFMWSAEAAMDIGIIQNVCDILSLNGIETYSGGILSFQNQHPNDWRPIFRDWTQLSTMHAVGTMLEVFLDAFVAPVEPPVAGAAAESDEALPSTQPPPLLPHLRTLIIDRANITSELGERVKTSLSMPECRVQAVQIHQCNVRVAFVDELKEIVADVHWDGKQNRTMRRPGPFWATGGVMEMDGFEAMDDATEESELVLGDFDGEP